MNNLHEIKRQFQFDCYGKLYAYLSQELLIWGGDTGERLIRQTVQDYGEKKGKALRGVQYKEGIGLNLQSLFTADNGCGTDPRFFRVIKRSGRTARLLEVYSCPLARLWREMGCCRAAFCYCEEYTHGLIRGYTKGKGQANVSNCLTCKRDSRCVLAYYCQPANMTEEEAKLFSEGKEAYQQSSIAGDMRLLYHCFYLAAQNQGNAALSAVARGLKRFTDDVKAALFQEAEQIGRILNDEFIRDFFPLELCGSKQTNQVTGQKDDAKTQADGVKAQADGAKAQADGAKVRIRAEVGEQSAEAGGEPDEWDRQAVRIFEIHVTDRLRQALKLERGR